MMNKIYNTDFGLIDLINKEKERITKNIYFGIIVVLLGAFGILHLFGYTIDFIYILCVSVLFVINGYLQYSQAEFPANIVNKTAVELVINKDTINVITSSFKILFWINKQSRTISFNINNLMVMKVSYPVKQIFDLDNRVIKLRDGEKEIFLIMDFFDQELNDFFLNFKT